MIGSSLAFGVKDTASGFGECENDALDCFGDTATIAEGSSTRKAEGDLGSSSELKSPSC